MFPCKRAVIAAIHDSIMAALSLGVALYLRLGNDVFSHYQSLWPSVAIFTCIATSIFVGTGLYRGVWRYASFPDLLHITKAASLAILVFLPTLFLFNRLEDFPRSVFIIHWLVLLSLLGGPRFLYRFLKDKTRLLHFMESNHPTHHIPVLLVGIGNNSMHFLRECQSGSYCQYRVIGLVDFDSEHVGRHVYGTPVLGHINCLEAILIKLTQKGQKPQRIILGVDHIDGKIVQHLLKISESLGLTLAKLPNLTDFKETIDRIDIKPIAIEDLLGRSPTTPVQGNRLALIKGQRVLVTGAGGTIGSELVRQIAHCEPDQIILVEQSEFNLYQIDKEISSHFPHIASKAILADIRDINAMRDIFKTYTPHLVFHAAALKHVPLVEDNLVEACLTNIIGVKIIGDLCQKYHVQKMIFISTDKAVNPSSFMGVTKRISERYISALSTQSSPTQFSTVRFGNVLGSSGSVIPLFQEQLKQGGPLTVTHPDMVRFFMTVPEAVELVLRAATLNTPTHSGNVFVLDMGEPIRIADLARQMIRLAGFTPDKEISIDYTGIRQGEKLYEELFYAHESAEQTSFEGIIHVCSQKEDLAAMEKALYDIAQLCQRRDAHGLRQYATTLVPQYQFCQEFSPQVERVAS